MLALQSLLMPQPASAPIEDGVIDVLKNVSRRPIEPSLTSDLIADLGFDSLQILEVIAELEDRFDISIPLNDVPATRTVAQLVAALRTLPEALAQGARADAGYCFVSGDGDRRRSYAELQEAAGRRAGALQA